MAAAAAAARPDDVCSVCLVSMAHGRLAMTPCRHAFHVGCLVDVANSNPFCPMCRAPLPSTFVYPGAKAFIEANANPGDLADPRTEYFFDYSLNSELGHSVTISMVLLRTGLIVRVEGDVGGGTPIPLKKLPVVQLLRRLQPLNGGFVRGNIYFNAFSRQGTIAQLRALSPRVYARFIRAKFSPDAPPDGDDGPWTVRILSTDRARGVTVSLLASGAIKRVEQRGLGVSPERAANFVFRASDLDLPDDFDRTVDDEGHVVYTAITDDFSKL